VELYLLLRLLHFAGFIFLGGGLLAVFVSELRAYLATETGSFVEAAQYTAIFYDGLVTPGAIMILISGPLLIDQTGIGYFTAPWIVGMWGLFAFEFIEGNTITRMQFQRTLRLSKLLPQDQPLTRERREGVRSFLGQFAHFLDIPLFLVIVYCGVVRPDDWKKVIIAIACAFTVAAILTLAVPRVFRASQ
jgi:hypothetical protein